MTWDIELQHFEDGALFAKGVTPRGQAWLQDEGLPSALYEDGSLALDPRYYAHTVGCIVAAGLTVADVTPSQGERASAAASQAARALRSY